MISQYKEDPLKLFDQWLEEARLLEEPLYDSMTLATSDSSGNVRLRTLLYKGRKKTKIRFFTNYQSKKSDQLRENSKASILFFWKKLYRQIRFDGEVQKLSPNESDIYWDTRPRESQIGAWASSQSKEMSSYQELEERVELFKKKFEDTDAKIPRPPHWGGFGLTAKKIEFWLGHEFRLHDRLEFEKTKTQGWRTRLLYP